MQLRSWGESEIEECRENRRIQFLPQCQGEPDHTYNASNLTGIRTSLNERCNLLQIWKTYPSHRFPKNQTIDSILNTQIPVHEQRIKTQITNFRKLTTAITIQQQQSLSNLKYTLTRISKITPKIQNLTHNSQYMSKTIKTQITNISAKKNPNLTTVIKIYSNLLQI